MGIDITPTYTSGEADPPRFHQPVGSLSPLDRRADTSAGTALLQLSAVAFAHGGPLIEEGEQTWPWTVRRIL